MSASDYVPNQDDTFDPEMPDLIANEDFRILNPTSLQSPLFSALSSSSTESASEEVLDSFTCKTSEATVTVSLAKVSLSPEDKKILDSSLDQNRANADSPIFVGACVAPVSYPHNWYKGKYPESSMGSPFSEPLITGRSFSLSQLDLIGDTALEAYRSINKDCTPIPSGFWMEFEAPRFPSGFYAQKF